MNNVIQKWSFLYCHVLMTEELNNNMPVYHDFVDSSTLAILDPTVLIVQFSKISKK